MVNATIASLAGNVAASIAAAGETAAADFDCIIEPSKTIEVRAEAKV
jgi:hypothetical protein